MNAFHRVAAIFLLGALGHVAAAQQTAPIAVKIDAQPMERALQSFAKQSGLQVIFPTELAKNLTSPQIDGRFSPQTALKLLLAGTQLSYQFVNDKTVAIRSASASTGNPTGALELTRAEYRLVQATPQATPRTTTQAPATATPPAESTGDTEGEVEVVSTKIDGLNKKSIFQATEEGALPYNVIDREDITRSGATSMEELFRHIPELSNYGNVAQSQAILVQVTGGGTIGANALNLRGMSAAQTVILVNGRRMAQGSTGSGPDVSRIPVGSVERIEILPAAAASIYGGGAMGGAINIILRKEYVGQDLTTYFGAASGGAEEYRFTFLDGRSFNEGRTRVSSTIDYSKRKALYGGSRDYLERMVDRYGPTTTFQNGGRSAFESRTLPALAGTQGLVLSGSTTLPLGIPSNPTARWALIPLGLDGTQATNLTRASFNATAGTYKYGSRFERIQLYRPQESYNVQTQVEHELLSDGRLSLFFEANASAQRQSYDSPSSIGISLEATHPYNPFRDTDGAGPIVGIPISILLDIPDISDGHDDQERDDARVSAGLKGKIGERWDWMADISASYAKSFAASSVPGNWAGIMSSAAPTATAAPLATRWPIYNPFQDHTVYPVTQANLDNVFQFVRNGMSRNRNAEFATRFVGEVWDLPAGPLTISPGFDYRIDDQRGGQTHDVAAQAFTLIGVNPANYAPSASKTSVDYQGAFFEAVIPVISPKWRPIPLHSLEFNLSRRYDDSNRSARVSTDSMAVRLGIVQDVILRASITDGYGLNRNSTATFTTDLNRQVNNVIDPQRGGVAQTILVPTYISGGNPELLTEFAESRNFGVMLRPRFIPGLLVSVDMYRTERYNTSASVSLNDLLLFPQNYPGRIQRAALTPAEQSANPSWTGGAITYLDLRPINLSKLFQRGVDYRVTYSLPLAEEYGTVDWTVNFANARAYWTQVRPEVARVDSLNVQNNPLSWKGSSQIFWKRGPVLAGLTGNYINSYYFNAARTATNDGFKAAGDLTFDVQLGYETPSSAFAGGWRGWLNGTDVRLGILNVLDKMPPMNSDGNAYYSRYSDPRQRYVYVNLKKTF